MDYLLLAAAAVLLAFDFCCNKIYQKKAGAGMQAGLRYNMLVGILTGVIFTGIHYLSGEDGKIVTPYSLFLASVMAVLGLTYLLIGFKMLKGGMMAVYTLFLMTGGMTLPYIWGVIVLNEELSVFRIIGLFLIFGGVFCANFKNQKTSAQYLIMGILVFCLNGMVSIVSKMHQIEMVKETVTSTAFVLLSGVVKAMVCAVLILFFQWRSKNNGGCKKHYSEPEKQDTLSQKVHIKEILWIVAASALIGGFSYLLQLIGARNLPATVLYPIITGGSIIGAAIAGRVFFREKIEKRMAIGILLCFAGTCCFL